MKIPTDKAEFCSTLIKKCFESRQDRKALYDLVRSYYLYGTQTPVGALPVAYNMIQEGVDTLLSFLFAGETTNFSIEIHPEKKESYLKYMSMAEKGAEILKDYWHDAMVDTQVHLALKWASVYNSMFLKFKWENDNLQCFIVDPLHIGVLNEYQPFLDRQECIIHSYYESLSSVERILKAENKEEKIAELHTTQFTKEASPLPERVQTIILNATTPNIEGHLAQYPLTNVYERPFVTEDMVAMYEIWIYDDKAKDFRRFVCTDSGVILFDDLAKDIFVEGEHPFVKLTPIPMYDYFWGYTEMLNILALQEWHTQRLTEIKKLLTKAMDPPKAGFGIMGLADEKAVIKSLNEPSGWYNFGSSPAGKIDEYKPQVPPEVFEELADIRGMRDNQIGLQDLMKGRGVSGVRSRGQAEILSSYGSSRLKSKALVIEDALERVGMLMFKLIKRNDPTHYISDLGDSFIMGQLPDNFAVKVDAHSSSPIFVSEQMDLAMSLFDRGVIGGDTLIQLLRVPMKSYLKFKAKAKEQEKAEMEKEATKEAQIAVLQKQLGRK